MPGGVMLLGGALFTAAWVAVALRTLWLDRITHRGEKTTVAMG